MSNRLAFVLGFTFLFYSGYGQGPQPELFGAGVISGPLNDAAPVFSPDGNTVYFYRSGPALTATILVSHLVNGVWSSPAIASFSGRWSDIEPAMAPDGSYLIFSSCRPIVPGGKPLNGTWNGQHYPERGGNLWRVDRKGTGWGEPYRLSDVVNNDSSIFSPAVTADGSLFFMKPFADTGKFHLYRCAYRDGRYEPPVAMSFGGADTIGDVDPAVAADESYLVFTSRRPPATQGELLIVFRKGGTWGAPQSLGAEVNRGVGNIEAKLSPDGRRLYFSCGWTPKPDAVGKKEAMEHAAWETGLLNIWSVPLDKWVGR